MGDGVTLTLVAALLGALQAIACGLMIELIHSVRQLRADLSPLRSWAQHQGFKAAEWV